MDGESIAEPGIGDGAKTVLIDEGVRSGEGLMLSEVTIDEQ